MAHKHLNFHHDPATEHASEKQFRISLALIGTLAGGTLLLSSIVARLPFIYGRGSFNTEFLEMAAPREHDQALVGCFCDWIGGCQFWHRQCADICFITGLDLHSILLSDAQVYSPRYAQYSVYCRWRHTLYNSSDPAQ